MASSADPNETTNTFRPAPEDSRSGRGGERACMVVLAGAAFGETFAIKGPRTVIGRGERAGIRISDDGISREHAAILVEDDRVILTDLNSTNGTFCNGARVSRQVLANGDKVAVGANTILKFTYQDELEASFQRQLYESALRDGLTNSFNRRYFLDRLNSEIKFAVRHKTAVTLLFIDIDHFKKINDTYGHPTGDFVLAKVSALIAASLRAEDVFARYGGEEFAVVCRDIDLRGAEILAGRLREAVCKQPVASGHTLVPVTVSIGVAVDAALTDVHSLIAAADAVMYEAKRTGRNRVCLHPPGTVPGLKVSPG